MSQSGCDRYMPIASSVIAMEYASSPVEQPALQIRNFLVAVTVCGARCHQRRHDVLAKKAELRGVAKETGLGDRDEVEQVAQLGFHQRGNRAAQAIEILVLVHEAEQLHPGGDRGRQRPLLAVVEAKPAAGLDEVAHGGERG